MPSRPLARLIARCMLVWFALYIGAAVASPLVRAGEAFELICSGGGTAKLIEKGDAGSMSMSSMDCPLCTPGAAPPPSVPTQLAPPRQQVLAWRLQSIPAARIAALTAAPLPARGPPTA